MKKLGDTIRARRRELKITQEALAFGCGVSPGCVAMWESTGNHSRQPSLDNRRKLAELLSLPLSELIEGAGDGVSGGASSALDGPRNPEEAALLRLFRAQTARQRKIHLQLFKATAGGVDPGEEESTPSDRAGVLALRTA